MREHLEYKSLGEIANFHRGLTYSKQDEVIVSKKGVLRSNNIDLETCSLNFDEIKYINDSFLIPRDKILKKDSILICMSNGSKQHLGKVAFIDEEYNYAFGGFMGLIIPNKEVIYPQYLYYSCQSISYKQYLKSIGNGANITNLKFQDLSRYMLPVPHIQEQKRIVLELDILTRVLTKKREQLKELDRLGQAVFYDMFGDPILNDRKWKSCNLSQICDVGSSKRVFVEDLVEKGIPFYRGTEIAVLSLGDKIIPKFYITEEHYNRLKELTGIPVYGDLLLPSICHEGKIWRVNTNESFYFKDGRVLWIHLNSKDVNGTYLQYMLREKIVKDYINIASVTTFSELKIFALKKVVVILPPINLQMKFAEQINAIESQKQKIKQSIVEVQQLLDYTMNKYFG